MRELIYEFVVYCTTSGDRTPSRLLELCDRILGAIHDVPEEFDDIDYEDPPDKEFDFTREQVCKVFPNLGYYNLPASVNHDIGNSEIEVADAIDDIADIVEDFKAFLWRCDHTSTNDAAWHLLLDFRSHWRRHLRDLQFCLERIDG